MKSLIAIFFAFAVLYPLRAEELPSDAVTVIGQVRSPGRIPIQESMSLWEVIEKSGGTTRIWGGKIRISRKESEILTHTLDYSFSTLKKEKLEELMKKIVLEPGDIVYVPEIVC